MDARPADGRGKGAGVAACGRGRVPGERYAWSDWTYTATSTTSAEARRLVVFAQSFEMHGDRLLHPCSRLFARRTGCHASWQIRRVGGVIASSGFDHDEIAMRHFTSSVLPR